MEPVYINTAKMLKAMSDPKRLRIVDMLSCGELCGCKILEEFHITQPTLSHDMKVLSEAGYSDVAKAYILYRKQREGALRSRNCKAEAGRKEHLLLPEHRRPERHAPYAWTHV